MQLEVSPLCMLNTTVLVSIGIRIGNSKVKFSLHELKVTSSVNWGLKNLTCLMSEEDTFHTGQQTMYFQLKREHYYH